MGEQPNQTNARGGHRGGAVQLSHLALRLSIVALSCTAVCSSQQPQTTAPSTLPDAPGDQRLAASVALPAAGPCLVRNEGATLAAAGLAQAATAAGIGELSSPGLVTISCPLYIPIKNWYTRFTNGPQVKPLTPKEKAWLAVRNVVDPFNAITILGTSGISVAADSHSADGPGFPGFGRSVGVSYTQDITGEFFDTFLIPSIVRQDPHYHRASGESIKHRIGHAILQVVWTQGDNGKGMLNYANLVGFAIQDEVDNLYVPGRATNLPSSAQRYGTALALAPTDNFITEFLPDLASHIHVQVVFVQRIINQVAKTNGAGGS